MNCSPFDVYQTHYSISFVTLMRHTNTYGRDYLKNLFIRVRFGGLESVACQFKNDNRLRMFNKRRRENVRAIISAYLEFVYALVFCAHFFLALSLSVCVSAARSLSLSFAIRLSLPVYLFRHCLSISICLWCVLT